MGQADWENQGRDRKGQILGKADMGRGRIGEIQKYGETEIGKGKK